MEDLGGTFAAKLPFPVRWLLLRPRDSIAALAAGCAVVTILVNALFMQSGPHRRRSSPTSLRRCR
jgi:hypothetical protein